MFWPGSEVCFDRIQAEGNVFPSLPHGRMFSPQKRASEGIYGEATGAQIKAIFFP